MQGVFSFSLVFILYALASLHSIAKVKRQINPGLKIDGVLMTMVDSRTINAREITAALRDAMGININVFNIEIPRAVMNYLVSVDYQIARAPTFKHEKAPDFSEALGMFNSGFPIREGTLKNYNCFLANGFR